MFLCNTNYTNFIPQQLICCLSLCIYSLLVFKLQILFCSAVVRVLIVYVTL